MAGGKRDESGGVFTESVDTLLPVKEDYLVFLFLFFFYRLLIKIMTLLLAFKKEGSIGY